MTGEPKPCDCPEGEVTLLADNSALERAALFLMNGGDRATVVLTCVDCNGSVPASVHVSDDGTKMTLRHAEWHA